MELQNCIEHAWKDGRCVVCRRYKRAKPLVVAEYNLKRCLERFVEEAKGLRRWPVIRERVQDLAEALVDVMESKEGSDAGTNA